MTSRPGDTARWGDVNSNGEGFTIAWGSSVLEPTCGHVRVMHSGRPVTDDVDGAVGGGGDLRRPAHRQPRSRDRDQRVRHMLSLPRPAAGDPARQHEPVMIVPIAPDLGAWLVRRRVQWDGVTLDADSGTLYDQGKRLPAYLTPHLHQLVDRAYVRLNDPIPDMLPCQRVTITNTGERLLDLLYDLRRCWLARQRAGLPRCRADLDTLARVLDGLHRPPMSPSHR